MTKSFVPKNAFINLSTKHMSFNNIKLQIEAITIHFDFCYLWIMCISDKAKFLFKRDFITIPEHLCNIKGDFDLVLKCKEHLWWF